MGSFQIGIFIRSVGNMAATAILFRGRVPEGPAVAVTVVRRVIVALETQPAPVGHQQAFSQGSMRPVAVHAGALLNRGMGFPVPPAGRFFSDIIVALVTEERDLLVQKGASSGMGRVAGGALLVIPDGRVDGRSRFEFVIDASEHYSTKCSAAHADVSVCSRHLGTLRAPPAGIVISRAHECSAIFLTCDNRLCVDKNTGGRTCWSARSFELQEHRD